MSQALPDNMILTDCEEMVRQIEAMGVADARVLAAMREVPRHLFVPEDMRPHAYEDHPLPIGHDQTISQPFIVARMAELLQITPEAREARVLDIGAGSGYAAAVLSRLASRVVGIERVPELAASAEDVLRRLGYENITILTGDGVLGYPPEAPYDAIHIACAAPCIPEPLVEQLADDGKLIMPVVDGESQFLVRLTRHGEKIHRETLIPVVFVPLITENVW